MDRPAGAKSTARPNSSSFWHMASSDFISLAWRARASMRAASDQVRSRPSSWLCRRCCAFIKRFRCGFAIVRELWKLHRPFGRRDYSLRIGRCYALHRTASVQVFGSGALGNVACGLSVAASVIAANGLRPLVFGLQPTLPVRVFGFALPCRCLAVVGRTSIG